MRSLELTPLLLLFQLLALAPGRYCTVSLLDWKGGGSNNAAETCRNMCESVKARMWVAWGQHGVCFVSATVHTCTLRARDRPAASAGQQRPDVLACTWLITRTLALHSTACWCVAPVLLNLRGRPLQKVLLGPATPFIMFKSISLQTLSMSCSTHANDQFTSVSNKAVLLSVFLINRSYSPRVLQFCDGGTE